MNARSFEAGPMEQWSEWQFKHPALPRAFPGKLMLGDKLDLHGMEVSLNTMPGGISMPFAHRHEQCEELYVFLRGKGEFKVDDRVFAITPGTCIAVAPEGSRAWRTLGDEPLVFLVIQASAQGAVRGIDDGRVTESPVRWAE